MESKKMSSVLMALALMLMGIAFLAPQVAAHECTAEEGEPNQQDCEQTCEDGEDHHHKVTHYHENGLAEDYIHTHYECKSQANPPPPPPPADECDGPEVLGMCVIDWDNAPDVGETVDKLLGGNYTPCGSIMAQPNIGLEVDWTIICAVGA